jgi:hypothetical protein
MSIKTFMLAALVAVVAVRSPLLCYHYPPNTLRGALWGASTRTAAPLGADCRRCLPQARPPPSNGDIKVYHAGTPHKVYAPSPTKVYAPSPTKVYAPSPTKVYAPSPTKVYAPSPTKVASEPLPYSFMPYRPAPSSSAQQPTYFVGF